MKKTTRPCNSPQTITTARRTDNIPLICTGAGPIHPVHSQSMSLATGAMPEMRSHFCHVSRVCVRNMQEKQILVVQIQWFQNTVFLYLIQANPKTSFSLPVGVTDWEFTYCVLPKGALRCERRGYLWVSTSEEIVCCQLKQLKMLFPTRS